VAALVQGSDGNFYGTTVEGGSGECREQQVNYGCGTVFSITPAGTLTTLYDFCSQKKARGCPKGRYPYAGLVQGADGKFYGATENGGGALAGTIFSVTAGGALTTLHSFAKRGGELPIAGLIQDTAGKFYGTTNYGGDLDDGTIFSLSVGLK
jgi:uncharacterized repeat protein (TIGR03803 family)